RTVVAHRLPRPPRRPSRFPECPPPAAAPWAPIWSWGGIAYRAPPRGRSPYDNRSSCAHSCHPSWVDSLPSLSTTGCEHRPGWQQSAWIICRYGADGQETVADPVSPAAGGGLRATAGRRSRRTRRTRHDDHAESAAHHGVLLCAVRFGTGIARGAGRVAG